MPVSHRVPHRGPGSLLTSPGALRAQALVIVLTLQVGVAAALSAPAPVPARPAPVDLAMAFAERPVASALLGAPTKAPAALAEHVAAPRLPAALTLRPTAPVRPPAPAPARKPGTRYVPEGTGMWTYQWDETEGGNARKVVSRARMVGLTHLYVRTGTRQGGFDGGPMLRQLLPATKGTGIKVIAWDFPQLKNPVADARRLAAAAKFTVPGAPRVAAVAPDIETGAEGTKLSSQRVAVYMSTLRKLLPNDVSIIGVMPWPSEKRAMKYPYGQVARFSDALAPMAYWVNRDPGTVAEQTMHRLRQFKKPVLPIGQAYDPRIDVPTLKWGSPSQAQVAEFLATARRMGAPSASLWVWQFAHLDHWKALQAARPLYAAGKR